MNVLQISMSGRPNHLSERVDDCGTGGRDQGSPVLLCQPNIFANANTSANANKNPAANMAAVR